MQVLKHLALHQLHQQVNYQLKPQQKKKPQQKHNDSYR
jgi:hypothetical protein